MLNVENIVNSGRLFDGHYKLLRPLSTEGATADVWLAIDTNTIDVPLDADEELDNKNNDESGMLVAIKIYRPKNALDVEGEQRFRDEYKIVYECRHENLLQPTNFSVYEGTPYLVLPYCKYGSSEKLIGKTLTDDEIWKFVLDVSSGLNRLHSNEPQIIHQDIKPGNVLIGNNKDYAITDFGISSRRNGKHGYYYDDGNSGTMAYMAPERFMENVEPMPQSDIWAFGATLCEILTGHVPFGEDGGQTQIDGTAHMPQMPHVSSSIQRLIYACLSKEPGNRPSARDIRNAALAKQFPVKSKSAIYAAVGVVCILAVGLVAYLFIPRVSTASEAMPIEQLYETALADLNANDTAQIKRGLDLMDSLSNQNYVPAIYQMAYTYGWYSDSLSMQRKRLLGIAIYEGVDEGKPMADKYTHYAMSLFQKMLEINDSAYADIKADAAYRLAGYYANEYGQKSKAKECMKQAEKFAMQAKDTLLLRKIKRNLEYIK